MVWCIDGGKRCGEAGASVAHHFSQTKVVVLQFFRWPVQTVQSGEGVEPVQPHLKFGLVPMHLVPPFAGQVPQLTQVPELPHAASVLPMMHWFVAEQQYPPPHCPSVATVLHRLAQA